MKKVLSLFMLVILVGCDKSPASQPITLYKGAVASGNGIVHFISHNDPNGIYSTKHCEALKKFYESSDNSSYVCSSVVYNEFVPRAEWRLAK